METFQDPDPNCLLASIRSTALLVLTSSPLPNHAAKPKNFKTFTTKRRNQQYLHIRGDLSRSLEWNNFTFQRDHGDDVLFSGVELNTVYALEEFLQMRLNHSRIGRLAQDLEQVIVSQEVESRKRATLFLKKRSSA